MRNIISNNTRLLSLALLLLFTSVLSILGHSTLAAPIMPKINLAEQPLKHSPVKQLSLIPNNFRFSQKQSLLVNLYAKLQQFSSKENALQVADAIEQLWLTSGSDAIDSMMSQALLAIEEQDYPQAIDILNKITQEKSRFAEAWNQKAIAYFLVEDYENAMINLQKALALDPKHFQAINGLAKVLQATGHKKAALQAYRSLLKINPHLNSAIKAAETLERETKGQKT